MCNLYSVTKGQSAIRDLFDVKHDRAGNLPPMPAVFPDQLAPIVRVGADGERELVTARWGMPGPPQFAGAPITNIRNVKSAHWRRWLGPASRCIVPATSFCEYADTKPRKTPIWFALSEDRPLVRLRRPLDALARCARPQSAPVDGEHELFGFLTTEANAIVAPIHPKAMPVILTTPERSTDGLRRTRLRLSRCNARWRMTRSGSWRRAKRKMLVSLAGLGLSRDGGNQGRGNQIYNRITRYRTRRGS